MQDRDEELMGLLSALLLASVSVSPATVDADHVKVRLVTAQAAVEPGGVLQVGLLIDVDPNWHVYWQNPGDSGEPPKIKWTLPAGWAAGPLGFPRPGRYETGPIVNYVHEGEALFDATLRVPAAAKPGSAATLSARLSWLVCQEDCIPGFATVTLSVPVAAKAKMGPDAGRFEGLFRPPQLETRYTVVDSAIRIAAPPLAKATGPVQFFGADTGVLKTGPAKRDGATVVVAPGVVAAPEGVVRGVLIVGDRVWSVRARPAAGARAPTAPSGSTALPGWTPWTPALERDLRAQGEPVFVRFTADWCAPCKVAEKTVFAKPAAQAAFAAAGVRLLVADYTAQGDDITAALNRLGQSSIPVYAYFQPGATGVVRTTLASVDDLLQMLARRAP